MAEQTFLQLFRSVDDHMVNLTTTVGAQGIARIVQNFDGSNPKLFKDWIKSIEKYSTLTGTPPDRTRLVAYQSSVGPVSDFLKRYLEANGDHGWDRIKHELRLRFGEVVDSQHALLLLRRVKQKQGESIQVYAERLLALGEDAFEGQGPEVIQRQLIGYFIDGLLQDFMKMKVMRENPNTFNDALRVATTEQNLRRRFQLRTGHLSQDIREETPMEVDHLRPRNKCFYCKRQGHSLKDCRLRGQNLGKVSVAQSQPQTQNKGVVICFKCGKAGHIAKMCSRQTKQSLNGSASHM